MPYTDKIEEINRIQSSIDGYGAIPVDLLNKINYKFRLEWNFTSNSMEGNSLTKRETRTIMVGLLNVEGKPLKDVIEIKQHDAVITTILKIGKGELNLSEKRIKEIHKGIMYEEDPNKQKLIGQWKNENNYLINSRNERFDFVSHDEVEVRIHELVNWLNAEKEKIKYGKKDALHPAIIAFKFHLDYLTIHPFYDGNGRTARILSNLILISYGYPPVYIADTEKNAYYEYLTDIQSYGGSSDLFIDFMMSLLLRSMDLVLGALEGKELEEPEDVFKEIALWKQHLTDNAVEPEVRSRKRIAELYVESFIPLFEDFNKNSQQAFFDLFAAWDVSYMLNDRRVKAGLIGLTNQVDRSLHPEAGENIQSFAVSISMKGFKKDGLNAFNIYCELRVDFLHDYKYVVMFDRDPIMEKLYSEKLSIDEQREILAGCVRKIFDRIRGSFKNVPLSEL